MLLLLLHCRRCIVTAGAAGGGGAAAAALDASPHPGCLSGAIEPFDPVLVVPRNSESAHLLTQSTKADVTQRSSGGTLAAVGRYCGEIIGNKEMKQRGLASTSEYLFNVGAGLTIDASRFGNVTRYMNHSSNAPNIRPMICNHFGDCQRLSSVPLAVASRAFHLITCARHSTIIARIRSVGPRALASCIVRVQAAGGWCSTR